MHSPYIRQQAALRYIIGYQEAFGGVSPSFMEIGAAIGYMGKSQVGRVLTALERKGHIRRLRYRARAIEVLRPISIAHGLHGEPLFFLPVKHG